MINRRKEIRYRVQDSVFAIAPHELDHLGEIVDISRSGISFRYMDEKKDFGPATKLNIFSSVHDLFLSGFPFESVSDLELKGHPTSTISMRRHSGRFVSLTPQQQEQLDHFIDLHSLYAL